MSFSLLEDGLPLLQDVECIEIIKFLIAQRIHNSSDNTEQRELIELLILIQDHAPRE